MEVCRCSIVSVKLTRLSGKVALALNGTRRAGATSGGLVKALMRFLAITNGIPDGVKQDSIKTVQESTGKRHTCSQMPNKIKI